MVTDGGPWRGITEKEWLERVSRPSTPVIESIPWIKPVDRHLVSREEPELSELEKRYLWGDR
jgi:hypothetical protein